MIVTEDQVETALAYLNDDPHPLALAKKDVVDAENRAKVIFARLYLSYTGSIPEREHRATCNPEMMEAKSVETEAIMQLERHKVKAKGAEMLLDCWRTEQSNIRAAERII